jgi:hypothetical protein
MEMIMQRQRMIFLMAILTGFFFTNLAFAEVGVSVTIDQPGMYGRIELGDVPRPEVVYRRAVTVEHVRVVQRPIYLHVPQGHIKHWNKHCYRYQACGRPVYFVREEWYERVYVPAKQRRVYRDEDHHHKHQDHHRGHWRKY